MMATPGEYTETLVLNEVLSLNAQESLSVVMSMESNGSSMKS